MTIQIKDNASFIAYASLKYRPLGIPPFETKSRKIELHNCEMFCRVQIGVSVDGKPVLCRHKKRFKNATDLRGHIEDHHDMEAHNYRSPSNEIRRLAIAFYEAVMKQHRRASILKRAATSSVPSVDLTRKIDGSPAKDTTIEQFVKPEPSFHQTSEAKQAISSSPVETGSSGALTEFVPEDKAIDQTGSVNETYADRRQKPPARAKKSRPCHRTKSFQTPNVGDSKISAKAGPSSASTGGAETSKPAPVLSPENLAVIVSKTKPKRVSMRVGANGEPVVDFEY